MTLFQPKIQLFNTIIANGHVERGSKPVYWCFDCGSSLAEAEVEYQDKASFAIDVRFPVVNPIEFFEMASDRYKALQKELGDSGVQVCTLSPGIVVTDLLVGDYDTSSPEWEKSKKIFNILGDKVETVTPWLVDGVLKADKDGARVEWLTGPKIGWRFMTAGFRKRDLFADSEVQG